MRADLVKIVNDLSENYGNEARAAGVCLPVDEMPRVLDIYKLIFEHCQKTGSRPRAHVYGIKNGVLTIDGQNIERVAGMINRPGYMRPGAFPVPGKVDYEARILARQEAY